MSRALETAYRVDARRIVERDGHVSWSVRRAVYHVITRLRNGRAQYWRSARAERRALWRGAREGVKSNRALYALATGSI